MAFLAFFFIYAPRWILPANLPRPQLANHVSCHDDPDGYKLEKTGICTNTCDRVCFPRVHGICFHHSEVTICGGQPAVPEYVISAIGGLPAEMRFCMEKPRMKVPVKYGVCPSWNTSTSRPSEGSLHAARWIRGLQMVADLTLMPAGEFGPNPHHEAEKLVPAIVLSQLSEFENSSLYWFADPKDPLMISKWSLGLLDVFSEDLRVEYVSPVAKGQPPMCFEDAILFARLTNSGYMPNAVTHDWFRKRVLEHCDVPSVEANVPVRDAVIVHRPNSSRNIWNYDAVKDLLETELQIPVKMAVPRSWSFCEQVKLIAEADIVLTPHGSQNVNLLMGKPGSTVIEAFPLLYYVDWYKHYLHAGRIKFYELFGTWPMENGSMPLRSRLYAFLHGWQGCFSVRHCMNYAKKQEIYVDLDQLKSLLQTHQ